MLSFIVGCAFGFVWGFIVLAVLAMIQDSKRRDDQFIEAYKRMLED